MVVCFYNSILKNFVMRIVFVFIFDSFREIVSFDFKNFFWNVKEFYSMCDNLNECFIRMLYYFVGFYDV